MSQELNTTISPEVASQLANPVQDSEVNPMLMGLPVTLSVEVGKSLLSLSEVSNLTIDSVVKLDKALAEPLNVMVNNKLVAKAELVVVENQYAARILEIVV